MTPLEDAVAQMQARVAEFGQGSAKQPKEQTTEWFMLRAAAAGLSFLQRMDTLKISHNAAACEELYRSAKKHFKQATP
jgi:hypothetical protein